MAQWFKKKTQTEKVLSFNATLLKEQMQNLSSRLYSLKSEISIHVIAEVIEMAKNVQILEVNRYKSEKELHIHQGRLQALSDLAYYLENSINNKPVKQEEKRSRDTIRHRSINNEAGAAI